jgi:hypothetical protein
VGSTVSGEEERKRVPVRGGVLLGRGLVLAMGWNASQGPFSYFSLLYFFFFSVFLILSQILQKCSKSIKTTFRDFTGITARF